MNGFEKPTETAEMAGLALPAARQGRLMALLDQRDQVTVNELVSYFDVSRDTIRRDLDHLELQGLLVRTHGGAVKPDHMVRVDTSLGMRMDAQSDAKQRIGEAAAALVRDNETLIINGGSTTCYFAAALGARQNLTIITNNLRIPPVVSETSVRAVHILGGTYWGVSQVTIGAVGFPEVPGISADTAIIGATGISAGGISMGRLEEATETAAMIRLSSRTIVLIDSSKFNVTAFARIADFSNIAHVVTNAEPPEAICSAMEASGTQLTVA